MKRGILWIAVVLAASGCGTRDVKKTEEQPAKNSAEKNEERLPDNMLRIEPVMLRDLRITTTTAELRSGNDSASLVGELRVNEDAYAEVGSPVAARIAEIHASLGQRVHQGQALAIVQSTELGKARGEYVTARARLELAQATLERKRSLGEQKIVPQREIQEAEAIAKSAEADLRSVQSTLRALGSSADDTSEGPLLAIRSPVAGTIIDRTAVQGQVSDPARPLFKVADLSRLWLTAHAFERDAVRIQPGGAARVTFAALPGQMFEGKVSVVGRQVDTDSRTVPVRLNAAGGFVVEGSTEWTVRAVGRARNVEDIRSTVVAVRGTSPVVLGDVAEVREAPAIRRGIAHRLRGEVVSCRVVKQFGADTVAVASGIRAAIVDLQKSLPRGVQLRIVYDQSELIQSALGGVGRAILIGGFLVIGVLFALLGNVRAALIVTLTMPLSVGLAGLILNPLQVGINTMTLGGLAIAVGLLVDAAIIMTENIVHRISERGAVGTLKERTLKAAIEVAKPIAFATLIVIAVFLPLFVMSGIEGRMYRPLAAAVIAAISASLILAVTLVPVLGELFIRPRSEDQPEDVWVIRRLKHYYAPVLDACLRRRKAVLLISVLLAVPSLLLAFRVGSDFMPKLDEGAFLMESFLPPEASLDEVDRVNHRLEDALREFPEVEDVVRRSGRAERTEDPMPHTQSDVLVVLKKTRQRDADDLVNAMRKRLDSLPGATVLFTTPLGMRIDEGLGGTPADISVRIFGPDLNELARLAEKARSIMADVRGVADLRVEKSTDMPQLRVTIDRAAVARVGLTPGDVIEAVRVGLAGEEVSEVWVGQRRFDLVVRLEDQARSDLNALRNLLIDGHDRTRIPLGQLASVEESTGPGAIRREASTRRIAVEASAAGRDLGSTADEIQSKLKRELSLPTGYFFDVGGKVESQKRATRSLMVAISVSLLGVFLLLYLALGSTTDAFLIVATLPVAFVGSILALLVSGETWNVSSLVGLIGLFGIAVQNGLVLVTQTRALLSEGKPFEDAVREASIGRVRPKLMTAATAIFGLLPILLLRLHGTEIERPLAVVMTGGLLTSTLFTLLALPTFYLLVHRLTQKPS